MQQQTGLRTGGGCRPPDARKHNAGTCPALVVKPGNLRGPLQVHIDVNIIEGAHQTAAFGALE